LKTETKGAQLLVRALDIIELLAVEREGAGVTAVASRLGLHKSTVHRILSALSERGYAEKSEDGSSYRLGLKLVEVSALKLNHLELKTEAASVLRKLADGAGQPVHLAILSGLDAVYIEKIDPISNLRLYSQIGRRIPAYCSALGKALLLGRSEAEIAALMEGQEFKRLTPHTLKDARAYARQVAASAARGWTVDDEEHDPGIRCVAAPVRDYTGKIIASLSMAGDAAAICAERDEENASKVMAAAAEISRRMGYSEGTSPRSG
jgi:DNA-binding IclR family transcriptional regulator